MEKEKLDEILCKHYKWLTGNEDGERADLRNTDLRGADLVNADLSGADLVYADLRGADLVNADLSGADLRYADLTGADLRYADLSGANLINADLRYADLSGADLRHADLRYADLSGANLINADLRYADLSGADLRHADLTEAILKDANFKDVILSDKTEGLTPKILDKYFSISCPEYGEFIGWKKTRGPLIVKLKITENAKRSSAFGRKCRCSEAVVLAIENIDGTPSDKTEATSISDISFIYRVGETVRVSDFDDNRANECAPGIHFFITRQEAVDYGR